MSGQGIDSGEGMANIEIRNSGSSMLGGSSGFKPLSATGRVWVTEKALRR